MSCGNLTEKRPSWNEGNDIENKSHVGSSGICLVKVAGGQCCHWYLLGHVLKCLKIALSDWTDVVHFFFERDSERVGRERVAKLTKAAFLRTLLGCST